jgi:hypothetical protein
MKRERKKKETENIQEKLFKRSRKEEKCKKMESGNQTLA